MKTLNYDNFHIKPGTKKEMYCRVCNTRIDLIPFDPEKYKGIGMGSALANSGTITMILFALVQSWIGT